MLNVFQETNICLFYHFLTLIKQWNGGSILFEDNNLLFYTVSIMAADDMGCNEPGLSNND